jgi:hypothetical protein
MWMVRTGPRSATAAVCEPCTTEPERQIAAGNCMVGCCGCHRRMMPYVPQFNRMTCSACAMAQQRRRKPSPPPLSSRTCAKCKRKFTPGRRGIDVRYCSRKRQLRARDDRLVAQTIFLYREFALARGHIPGAFSKARTNVGDL